LNYLKWIDEFKLFHEFDDNDGDIICSDFFCRIKIDKKKRQNKFKIRYCVEQ